MRDRKVPMGSVLLLAALWLLATLPAMAQPEADLINKPDERGSVTQWLVMAMFPMDLAEGKDPELAREEAFAFDYLTSVGGEQGFSPEGVNLISGTTPGGQGYQVKPQKVTGRGIGLVSLKKMYRGMGDIDKKVAYAFCYVEAEEAGPHMLLLGSDDSAKVWVNGELVHDVLLPGRGLKIAEDHLPIELNAGLNTILLKIENNSGPWGYAVQVFDEKGMEMFEKMGTNFTSFSFKDNKDRSDWLSAYLKYHFDNRLGNINTLFNKEYVVVSDIWLADAYDSETMETIQNLQRKFLLEDIPFDPDGYVNTLQHISHSHEHGWPFPLWPQIYGGHMGKTMGWHFQTEPQAYGVWQHRMIQLDSDYAGERAANAFELSDLKSNGIVDNAWSVTATGDNPTITTPEGIVIDAYNSPYLQIRMNRTGTPPNNQLPYLEWMREGDDEFSPERRVYLSITPNSYSEATGFDHYMVEMSKHPQWEGTIKRMRINLAPGEMHVEFSIDSFFTVYDTRHTINNPIYILACWEYFRWTRDIDFLQKNINRIRTALRYQQTVLGGLEHNFIRNPWIGHDGTSGIVNHPDGTKEIRAGHGIGNNYYDLLPFGGDDMYSTSMYYASTLAMARIEELVQDNPGWGVASGYDAFDPEFLNEHAATVKETANNYFWNEETGRFFACVDATGEAHDYGFIFLNMEALWFDIATPEHAKSIMDWISGRRIVEGDTSTGEDIYRWKFGPRLTTLRNVDWYNFAWALPESIPWGNQVQDGGGVLGFSLYDLIGRIKVYGPDDAWERLKGIYDWEQEVWEAGGYRPYYNDTDRGTTLQGGGTAGGIGIDFEFFESSLIPRIVPTGFMGLEPEGDHLSLAPNMPTACPEMTIFNLYYRYNTLDVTASNDAVTIKLKTPPVEPIMLRLEGNWESPEAEFDGEDFILDAETTYTFKRIK